MATSRERVKLALSHSEPDRVPLDLGGSAVSGMHASSVYNLRQALEMDPPGTPVRVIEPYQMLGEIKPDLMDSLGVDVVALALPTTFFGYDNTGWKPWTLFDGTPVEVPEGFNTDLEPSGDILMYPQGDRSAPPSGRMPNGGFYFDAIIRQPPIDEDKLSPEDNLEEFGPISQEDLDVLERDAERLYNETDKAILLNLGGTSFGDIAFVPGLALKHPKGIRDVEEWYVSTVSRRDLIYRIFERQCELGINNLEKVFGVVGDKVDIVFISGTDFGAQNGSFISPNQYRDLFQPFHREVNRWVHKHTPWKTFTHTCGSILNLIPDFIEAGFDILNPVQTAAANMDPRVLKRRFGDQITFWGGGVDTQRTLPFGSPEEVCSEVAQRIRIFGPGGGFIFNTIHNVQAKISMDNLLALYTTVKESREYPLG